jgi:hypothetical protein
MNCNNLSMDDNLLFRLRNVRNFRAPFHHSVGKDRVKSLEIAINFPLKFLNDGFSTPRMRSASTPSKIDSQTALEILARFSGHCFDPYARGQKLPAGGKVQGPASVQQTVADIRRFEQENRWDPSREFTRKAASGR